MLHSHLQRRFTCCWRSLCTCLYWSTVLEELSQAGCVPAFARDMYGTASLLVDGTWLCVGLQEACHGAWMAQPRCNVQWRAP